MYCKQNAELQLIITKSTMEGNDVSSEQWEGWLADWVATASSAAWGDHLACTKTGFVNTEAAEQAHEIVEAAKKLDIDLAVRKVSRANEAFLSCADPAATSRSYQRCDVFPAILWSSKFSSKYSCLKSSWLAASSPLSSCLTGRACPASTPSPPRSACGMHFLCSGSFARCPSHSYQRREQTFRRVQDFMAELPGMALTRRRMRDDGPRGYLKAAKRLPSRNVITRPPRHTEMYLLNIDTRQETGDVAAGKNDNMMPRE